MDSVVWSDGARMVITAHSFGGADGLVVVVDAGCDI
jgi:hypothetical protein